MKPTKNIVLFTLPPPQAFQKNKIGGNNKIWESYIPRFTFTIIDLYVLVSYYSMYNMKLVLHIFEDGSQIDLY
jgi:hypothetical protein